MRDPLFLVCVAGYCANRWLLKQVVSWEFLHNWFSDLLLAPCAIPVVLWTFRALNLRSKEAHPSAGEIVWILAVWSVLFEWVGPALVPHATGDWRDVAMYAAGGLVAWCVWNKPLAPTLGLAQ